MEPFLLGNLVAFLVDFQEQVQLLKLHGAVKVEGGE